MSDTTTTARPSNPARKPASPRQKVPPFARYKGTSVWRKDRNKVREYARYLASLKPTAQA